MIIPNDTEIILPPNVRRVLIINNGEEPILIEGGRIIIEFKDEKEYLDLKERIISNDNIYEYTIIEGNYEGRFDDIKLLLPSDIEENCEVLNSKFKEEKLKYSITFSIDSSPCSSTKMKWWVILLITISCVVIIVSIITAIYLLKYKNVIKSMSKSSKDKAVDVE